MPEHMPDPIERVDPRDFLDPTARAVAYLDLDDADGARRALSAVSLARLRLLGQHYDQLSMICFELSGPRAHARDNTVEALPDAPGLDTRMTPVELARAPEIMIGVDDLDDLTDPGVDALGDEWRRRHVMPAQQPPIEFEVDDLADLPTADTAGRHPVTERTTDGQD
jgi:hypothetical protein